ncbi:MAG: cyclase family protein [Calditrichaeota bacterium]|nr:cyclase family protein [Calditrichota bacterium]
MKVYDITVPITPDIPVWPGDQALKIRPVMRTDRGDPVNLSAFSATLHLGTHVDAPFHLFDEGQTVDALPLSVLIGPALVVEIDHPEHIDRPELERIHWPAIPRVLFKTRNSEYWKSPRLAFQEQFVSLTGEAAAFLVEQGIKLVGIDYLSVDLYANQNLDAHKILLRNAVVVVEGLNLLSVPPGIYELFCLPLNIVGVDGAPARVILREFET